MDVSCQQEQVRALLAQENKKWMETGYINKMTWHWFFGLELLSETFPVSETRERATLAAVERPVQPPSSSYASVPSENGHESRLRFGFEL